MQAGDGPEEMDRLRCVGDQGNESQKSEVGMQNEDEFVVVLHSDF
jgi:hypothetical protein